MPFSPTPSRPGKKGSVFPNLANDTILILDIIKRRRQKQVMGCCIFGFPQAHTVVSRSFCEYLSLVSSPLICERTVLSSLSLRCFFMASFLSSISFSLRAFSWFSIFSSQRRALARRSLQTTHHPELKPCRPTRTCKANQVLTVPANTLCAAEKQTLQERRATHMHLKKKKRERIHAFLKDRVCACSGPYGRHHSFRTDSRATKRHINVYVCCSNCGYFL